jgi:peptidyl-prolyl cis-trans isomerase C
MMVARRTPAGCFLLATAVLLLLSSCQGKGFDESPDTVAAIGEHAVHYQEFEEFLERSVGLDALGLENKVMSALFDQFLDEQLLKQVAIERELATVDSNSRAALDALLRSEGLAEVSAAEIDRYYEEHRSAFELPERVELRQILVEEREQAEAAKAELDAGTDFVEVAKRVSIDPSAPYGGYQGELGRDDLPVALADTIFGLEEGQHSDIVEADYGFHIFFVARRLPAETQPLQAASDKLRSELSAARADAAVERLLEEARQRYNLVILTEKLPFTYEGERES